LIKRKINSSGGSLSIFDRAEGFSTGYKRKQSFTLEPDFVEESIAESRVSARFATDNGLHQQVIRVNGAEVFNETMGSYEVRSVDFAVGTDGIKNRAVVEFEGVENNFDRNSVPILKLTYPRQFNFDGTSSFHFQIDASTGRKYLEIENFDVAQGDPLLYDVTNNTRMPVAVDNELVKIGLPAAPSSRMLFLVNQANGVQRINQLEAVNFTDYRQLYGDYIMITHTSLFDDGQGTNYVQQYADYRASAQGGSYQPIIIDVEQLYEQFSYGIPAHPLSVRNFTHFVTANWAPTKFIFLLGKGREYSTTRRPEDVIDQNDLPNLIPTFGVPGSDNLLVGEDNMPIPRIPVGRLSVAVPREIDIYLRKVKAFERNLSLSQTIENKGWMKQIIHLGGGDAAIQGSIRNHLSAMENVIESSQFGGEVSSFYKTSSDPVQISTSEEIFDRINAGISILTFFGHSGTNTFDFNIDNPDNYENKDKYPLMFSLGCFSGNIHTHFRGVSERFTFNEDKGAIGFAASTSLGFIPSLRIFMESFYNLVGNSLYGETIGKALQENIGLIAPSAGSVLRELVQQFTLHADPALRLTPAPGPDYLIDSSSIRFQPKAITSSLDSFEVVFDVKNIGVNVNDSITIKVEQDLPNGNRELLREKKILAPGFLSQQKWKLPSFAGEAVGKNTLYISLDINNEVEELPSPGAEMNNDLALESVRGIEFYVVDNSVTPLLPIDRGIIGDANFVLKASTGDLLAEEKSYVFEIDTTQLFNSPFKRQGRVTQKGGVVEWQPNLSPQSKTVYYWRVSPDSISTEASYIWERSSFLYESDAEKGWNPSNFFQ